MRLFDLLLQQAGEMTASGLMLRLALAACSMFAVVHLLSLWGTRYGDRHTLAKSFFLSLVVHCCLCLGWVAVVETMPSPSDGPEPVSVETQVTLVDAESAQPSAGNGPSTMLPFGAGRAPKLLPQVSEQLSRTDRDLSVPEVDDPQRDRNPDVAASPLVPDFNPQREESSPELEAAAPRPTNSAPASLEQVEQPVTESRPNATANPAIERSIVSRPEVSDDVAVRPKFSRGSAVRPGPTIEDGMVMTLPSEIEIDALPLAQGTPSDITIRRPQSPDPGLIVDSVAGSGSDGNANVAGTPPSRRTDRVGRTAPQSLEGTDDRPARPVVSRSKPSSGGSIEEQILSSRLPADSIEELPQPTFVKPSMPSIARKPVRAAEPYQARTSEQRPSSVRKSGGSDDSERAVEASLKWLASVQESDGRWSSVRHGGGAADKDPQGQPRFDGGKFADSGVTGLVVLSFLGAGYTHENGPYTEEVRKALEWLIAQQQGNGFLGGSATKYDQNYCHAIATFALAEAYAMQRDPNEFPALKTAIKRGVKLICALQNEDGGWRYGKTLDSDMSMFGWQLMALKSAVNAGIPVPEDTRRGMVRFLDARARGKHGGLAGYKKEDPPTPAMTAEALFCRQMFNANAQDAANQEATAYLLKNLPRVTVYDEYYWYYGTLAMRQFDNEDWRQWNRSLRDLLISLQRKDGPAAGSWDPRGKWAGIGGRLYSTTLATMCLEVYYRYQPTTPVAETP